MFCAFRLFPLPGRPGAPPRRDCEFALRLPSPFQSKFAPPVAHCGFASSLPLFKSVSPSATSTRERCFRAAYRPLVLGRQTCSGTSGRSPKMMSSLVLGPQTRPRASLGPFPRTSLVPQNEAAPQNESGKIQEPANVSNGQSTQSNNNTEGQHVHDRVSNH